LTTFIIDADLPRSLVSLFNDRGHAAHHVSDLGMGRATDHDIARFARQQSSCIVSGDFDFADIRTYPPAEYSGIVVFVLPRTATAPYIRRLAAGFLSHSDLAGNVRGKLVVVEPMRIRVRT
jgi:hypothetical protein